MTIKHLTATLTLNVIYIVPSYFIGRVLLMLTIGALDLSPLWRLKYQLLTE